MGRGSTAGMGARGAALPRRRGVTFGRDGARVNTERDSVVGEAVLVTRPDCSPSRVAVLIWGDPCPSDPPFEADRLELRAERCRRRVEGRRAARSDAAARAGLLPQGRSGGWAWRRGRTSARCRARPHARSLSIWARWAADATRRVCDGAHPRGDLRSERAPGAVWVAGTCKLFIGSGFRRSGSQGRKPYPGGDCIFRRYAARPPFGFRVAGLSASRKVAAITQDRVRPSAWRRRSSSARTSGATRADTIGDLGIVLDVYTPGPVAVNLAPLPYPYGVGRPVRIFALSL